MSGGGQQALGPQLMERVIRLLASVGVNGEFAVTSLAGGANNRVFRLHSGASSIGVVKAYFSHPDDPRNRARAEFAFSLFAWGRGVRSIPEPIAYDDEAQVGLYAYVDGVGVAAADVDEDAVAQAVTFYRDINRHRDDPEAQQVGEGSEACFSMSEHLKAIDRRVRRLTTLDATTAVDRDAMRFVNGRLLPLWESLSASIPDDDSRIGRGDRCLSPSDFGFHNALRLPSGELRFLDFEYAGWDDPAKLVCDFFCQPKVPASVSYFDLFARAIGEPMANPERAFARATSLLPAYRLKWACILLNDFLPVGARRRRFAVGAMDEATRKATQLAMAQSALDRIA